MKLQILILLNFSGLIPGLGISQIDSGYVKTSNCDLFYRIYGEGEPVVFLNGGPGFASSNYTTYADSFSRDVKMILFDQRGTGKSKLKNPTGTVLIKTMVKDLEALRKHFGYEKWTVYGHSFGGEYANAYALHYPESIKKMVISASPKTGDTFGGWQKFLIPENKSLTESEWELVDLYLEEEKKPNPSAEVLNKLRLALLARYYVSNPQNYRKVANWFLTAEKVQNYRVEGLNWSDKMIVRKLNKFEQPVLIIHGFSDFINIKNPLENGEYYPNSEVKIIEDSGHIMMVDQPEKYVRIVREFLLSDNNQSSD